jgi:hypothetical protein
MYFQVSSHQAATIYVTNIILSICKSIFDPRCGEAFPPVSNSTDDGILRHLIIAMLWRIRLHTSYSRKVKHESTPYVPTYLRLTPPMLVTAMAVRGPKNPWGYSLLLSGLEKTVCYGGKKRTYLQTRVEKLCWSLPYI